MKDLVRTIEGFESDQYRKEVWKQHGARFTFQHTISRNPKVELAKRDTRRFAKTNLPVILLGSSGIGKELFAHAIHSASPIRSGPFIKVNCAAIPDELAESEFFGYEDGAFTGARRQGRRGKFEMANGGTLFLDEIGDMSPNLQTKLLRVLQDGEFERVGGNSPVYVNVRVIAATNKNLEVMVKEGLFRLDFYYRLNVITIHIPSLSEHIEDISLLANCIINKFNPELGTKITGVTMEALQALKNYNWPGNIRELENVIRRAMYFSRGNKITRQDLPGHIYRQVPEIISTNMVDYQCLSEVDCPVSDETESEMFPFEVSLISKEQQSIMKALELSGGNRTKAAEILGIGRATLNERMVRLGINTNKKKA